jgi:hypothetical protein
MFKNPPVVLLAPAVPTNSLPFATLGTENLTAIPEGTSALGALRVHDELFTV